MMKKSLKIILMCCLMPMVQTAQSADIVIDAGHGGHDPGAVRPYKGKMYYEKDLTLFMAKELNQNLQKKGYSTKMLRTNDTFIHVNTRLALAKRFCKKLFVSLHVDVAPHVRARGVTAFALASNAKMAKRSMQVAEHIQNAFSPERYMRTSNKYAVLKNLNCPTILVEMGYMTHTEDLGRLVNVKQRQKMVVKLSNTLDKALKSKPLTPHEREQSRKQALQQKKQNTKPEAQNKNKKTEPKKVETKKPETKKPEPTTTTKKEVKKDVKAVKVVKKDAKKS